MVSVMPVVVAAPAARVAARGVAASEASEAAPAPEAFRARTRNRYAAPSVRPVRVCDRVVEVLWISVQSVSQGFAPSFFLYCHLVSGAVPVTEDVRVSSPLPVPAVAAGFAGFGGRVANGDAAASSVEQLPSLYALKV